MLSANIPITSITKNSNGSWTFSWAAVPGATGYRVVLWGVLLDTVAGTSYTTKLQGYVNAPPPLEVVAAGSVAITEMHLPYLVMQWYGQPCQYYQIEQSPDMGTTWNLLARLQETGLWIYTHQTVILKDETTYDYRVVAVDQFGNRSTPKPYTRYVVTCPVSPSVTISYANEQISVSPPS